MADITDKTQTEPGSLTQKADASKERVAEVSNVSRTISQMQKNVEQQVKETKLNLGKYEQMENVQNSMIKVLSSLSYTVGKIGRGFGTVAAETAKASKDTVAQYAKAISEDVNINKQNFLAMTLARSTPIFGYFAAKFMETDVFRKAKERMSENISKALGSVTSKLKEGFGAFLSKIKLKSRKEKPVKPLASEEKLPHLQKGGFVEKAGAAILHPAEVVVPIDKILQKIDESVNVAKTISETTKEVQLKALTNMETYVKGIEHKNKVGIFKGFLRATKDVQKRYTEPANMRMLRAVLAIQNSIGATVGTWPQVFQRVLLEHPTFTKIMFSLKQMRNVIGVPIKLVYALFKSRGGYKKYLSRSKNPMEATAENVGALYVGTMWRLDQIALFTKASAEASRDLSSMVTGKSYAAIKGLKTGRWSFASFLRKGLGNVIYRGTGKLVEKIGEKVNSNFTTELGKALNEIGKAIANPRQIGITAKGRRKKVIGEGLGASELLPDKLYRIAEQRAALPVSEIHLKEIYDLQKVKRKEDQKLLGYTKSLSKTSESNLAIQKIINKRQKKNSIFSAGFGIIKHLLSGIFNFIPMLLGGGLFRKFLPRGLLSGIGKTFGIGISKSLIKTAIPAFRKQIMERGIGSVLGSSIKKGLTSITTKIPSMISSVMAGITTVLTSPATWVAVAGVISISLAHKLGQALANWEKKKFKEEDIKASKLNKEVLLKLHKEASKAKPGTIQAYSAREKAQLQTTFAKTQQYRSEQVGFWGRAHLDAINEAQKKYMNEHINEYLKYGPSQVTNLRELWLRSFIHPPKSIFEDPFKYGTEREKSFLDFLKTHGKKLSNEKILESYKNYKTKYQKTLTGKVIEKGEEIAKRGEEIAREGASEILAATKPVVDQLKKYTEKTEKVANDIASKVVQGIQTSTHIVSSTVNNVTQAVNNGQTGNKYMSPSAAKVLSGGTYEQIGI